MEEKEKDTEMTPQPEFTREEMERREQEAYLRGRNEAVEAKVASELHTEIPTDPEPGIESIFHFRESIWQTRGEA